MRLPVTGETRRCLRSLSSFSPQLGSDLRKTLLAPDFHPLRLSVPFGANIIYRCADAGLRDVVIGVEICEDLWVPQPPSCDMALAGATIALDILHLFAMRE